MNLSTVRVVGNALTIPFVLAFRQNYTAERRLISQPTHRNNKLRG
jgi:hypothetical protein